MGRLRLGLASGPRSLIGGGDLGVMLVEARPATMMQVAAEIERAEEQTTMRFVEALGKEVPYPSALRTAMAQEFRPGQIVRNPACVELRTIRSIPTCRTSR
jgi:hypothetical protein